MSVKIKGVSVKSLYEYVKEKHSDVFNEWLDSIALQVRQDFSDVILVSKYYDLTQFYVEPLEKLANLVFENDAKHAAFEIGYWGGQKELSGIYALFLKIPSIDFIISKFSTLLNTYYEGISGQVLENSDKHILLEFDGFNEQQSVMIYNISGFVKCLLEKITRKKFTITQKIDLMQNNQTNSKILIKFE